MKSSARSSQKRAQKASALSGWSSSDAIDEAHAGRDRREGHRRATARVGRERVEEREHVRQRGPAESLQRARALVLLVRVVGGQLRQRASAPELHVLRVGVHEARQIEELRSMRLFDALGRGVDGPSALAPDRIGRERRHHQEENRLVASSVGIAQRTRRRA